MGEMQHKRRRCGTLLILLATLLFLLGATAQAAERLGRLPVDPAEISVAGFSSGAFMANQLHIAHSADIMGAAMIAGGLYGCAVQDVTADGVRALVSQAIGPCTRAPFRLGDVARYKEIAEKLAASGAIDSPSNLQRARIYYFTGGSDLLVASETIEKGRDLYLALGARPANIVFEDHSGPAAKAGHAWVTKSYGHACDANEPPYINACAYDQSEAELNAIYGSNLEPPAVAPSGRIVAFDQTEFAPGKAAEANGLSKVGYLFVPKACEAGAVERCRLQIVLHGCTQSAEVLGDVFYTKIGLNDWADSNRIIVLYPQAHAIEATDLPASLWRAALQNANPLGCWNWSGYAADSHYLTKNGAQIGAIWKMIERLEGK
jgi:poly(3-hydroxybutyrate) depolymerase